MRLKGYVTLVGSLRLRTEKAEYAWDMAEVEDIRLAKQELGIVGFIVPLPMVEVEEGIGFLTPEDPNLGVISGIINYFN